MTVTTTIVACCIAIVGGHVERELRGGRAAGAGEGELSIRSRESRLRGAAEVMVMAELDFGFWILLVVVGRRPDMVFTKKREKRRMRLLIDGQAKDSSGLSFVRQQAAATYRHKTHSKSNSTIFHTIL